MTALKTALAAAAIAAAAAFALPLHAARTVWGSGNPITQPRPVSGFTGIGLAIPARVEVAQGETESLTLTVDDNLAAEVETVVVDGMLHIRWRKGVEGRARSPIRITVNARELGLLSVAGSGTLLAPALTARTLSLHIAGSGDARVGGRAETIEVRIAGSGDVDASRLDAQRATVHVAGSGDARVVARKSLDVHVAGSGDVRYYGDPAVSQRVAGSGSVRRAGAAPG